MRNLAQPPNLLQTNDELREHLADRLRSGAWWLFVSASPPVTGLLEIIEKRFYGGSANADFELAIIPSQLGRRMTVVALARKHRMPARKLLRTLARFIPEMPEAARVALATGKHDVLILDDAGPTNGRALQMAFLEFLQPGAALRAAMRN